MIKSLLLASAVLTSFVSFKSAFAREAVIKSYTVAAANGGINPDFSGIRISAVVETYDSGCEATRSHAILKMVDRDGEKLIVAQVTPLFIARHTPCAATPADFEGLKTTQYFTLSSADFAATKLANVKELGNNVSLNDQARGEVAAECLDAAKPVYCTMDFNPASCTYGEHVTSGSNSCAAKASLKRAVCAAEKSFAASEVVCKSTMSK